MLKNDTIKQDYFSIKDDIIFSFGKSNNKNENSITKMDKNLLNNENINNIQRINDREANGNKILNCISIFKLLNKNKVQAKDNVLPLLNIDNKNLANNTTKPRLEIIKNNFVSPQKNTNNNNKYYFNILDKKERKLPKPTTESEPLFQNKNNKNNFLSDTKKEIMQIFDIKEESELPYEIAYLLDNPRFHYDFEHQNDINSNYQYVNENFIDILLNSFNNKMILNFNIKSIKEVQKEITFPKRNILVSWLTEINYKYIKDQNILFTAIKFLDRILYRKNININDFQLIGILCFNLALKMENHHKVFYIDEIISLIGGIGDKEKDLIYKSNLIKKIKIMENKICDFLKFEFVEATSISILRRLIQMINIQNKRTEELFTSIAFFFLELSLYDEKFYEIEDFSKALSSLIMAKEIMKKYYYKMGFHNYLENCAKLKKNSIKLYFNLCVETIRNLKKIKYGNTIFLKYQQKDFHNVIDNYLNIFILHCIQNVKKEV